MHPSSSSESSRPRSRSTLKVSDREGHLKLPSTRQTEPVTLFASKLAATEQSQVHPPLLSTGANRTAFATASSEVRNKRCASFNVSSQTTGSNEVKTSGLADGTYSAATLLSSFVDARAIPRPKPVCCSSS